MNIQIVADINDAAMLADETFNTHLRDVYEAFSRSKRTDTPLEIKSRLILPTYTQAVRPTSLSTARRGSYVRNQTVAVRRETIVRHEAVSTKWVNCLGESHVFRRGRVQLELYPAYHTGGPFSLPFGEPKSCDLRFLVVLESMGSPELSKFIADVSARRFSVPTLLFALADWPRALELTLCPLSVGQWPRHALVGMVLGCGEPIEVRGATPDGQIVLAVPRWQHEVSFVFGGRTETIQAKLETLIIDLDAESMVLTWAASTACDRQALEIREIKLNPILNC